MRKNQIIKNCEYCTNKYSSIPSANRQFCSSSCKNKFIYNFHPEVKQKIKQTITQQYKEGRIAWNKNKFIVPNRNRRQRYYRRLILEISNKPCCNRCGNEGKLLVHHKDRNTKNDDWLNLEPLCYSCHSKEHNLEKNFRYYGYEAVLIGKQREQEED